MKYILQCFQIHLLSFTLQTHMKANAEFKNCNLPNKRYFEVFSNQTFLSSTLQTQLKAYVDINNFHLTINVILQCFRFQLFSSTLQSHKSHKKFTKYTTAPSKLFQSVFKICLCHLLYKRNKWHMPSPKKSSL